MTAASLFRPTLPALWRFLAVALPTLAALAVAMPTVDLAYHLRAGADILDGGGIPTSDAWTFTIPGAAWTDQQWGAQVVFAAVFRVAGWNGLAILRAGLVALVFGLLFAAIRRRAPSTSLRAASLLVLAAFVVAVPALALRPQLLAMVLFAATLLLLADRAAHPRRAWLIPVLAIAWANVHGTFPLAIALCGLAWLGDVRRGRDLGSARGLGRLPGGPMLAITLVTALATLANPFGFDAWTYVARLATNSTIGSRVSEWRPPGITDVPGLLFWLSVVAVAALIAFRARRRRAAGLPAFPAWPLLLTLGLFAALGAATGRGLAWWPLVAVVTVAGIVGEGAATTPPSPSQARRSPLNAVVAGVLLLAGLALLPFWRPIGPAGAPNGLLSYAPQALTKALSTTVQSPARVWNPQRWGSWLEQAVPKLQYALDSRIELFPTQVWSDADVVSGGTGDWAAVLTRYGVDAVVTDPATDGPLERALESAGSPRMYWGCDGSIWWVGPIEVAGTSPAALLRAPTCP